MKRRRHMEGEDTDRWVVSYADFITLLFAFFTALYAVSAVDAEKLGKFVRSLKDAFRTESVSGKGVTIPELSEPRGGGRGLEAELRAVVAPLQRDAEVRREERGIVVSLGEDLLFNPGSADLKEDSLEALAEIALVLKGVPNRVIIEGHTDNLPVGNSHGSNWKLSALRAVSVLNLFIERFGLPPERFIVAGYGEYRPVRENTTPEGRKRNRRVDIVVLTERESERL